MHLHILGICGTFMGGVALLARDLGHRVTGSDQNVYPPMSTLLEREGIVVFQGDDPAQLEPAPELVIVGNALSRGNPAVEAMLNRHLRYVSGPQWLRDAVLAERTVLAVAGTHGKTTTASLLAFILDACGHAPGFLIGGIPENFGLSARLGESRYFVVEADEYDTAFFDKRSKFVHYCPDIAILNNLEFDHADIFAGIDDIVRQFHHLVRTVPGSGRLIVNAREPQLDRVLNQGCWTPVERFIAGPADDRLAGVDWQAIAQTPDASQFRIYHAGEPVGEVHWNLIGAHNLANAVAALAAASAAGVEPRAACAALAGFRSVRRRLEIIGQRGDIRVFEDFAHHPTAIRTTLDALRHAAGPDRRLIAVFEPRSNTMRLGVHRDALVNAFASADRVLIYCRRDLDWDAGGFAQSGRGEIFDDTAAIIDAIATDLRPNDWMVVMSNGGFEGLPRHLTERLGIGSLGTPGAENASNPVTNPPLAWRC